MANIDQIELPDGTTYNLVDNTKLPLAGGTMTGLLKAQANVYTDSYTGALDMQNSNIYGVNAIYTADTADGAGEGINFYRDSTHVDTLWMTGGDILFVPNRVLGTNTSAANSQKVGRFTANPTSGQVVITDGTTGGMKSSGYTIATSVPSDAVFTDTKNTAGSTDTSSKIFLVGATSQAANPQTYSDDQVYVTSGTLQTNNTYATVSLCANTGNSSTAGGISLYASTPTTYGIAMRGTGNGGKHGYVQGDWAIYNYMSSGTTRGWVYRYGNSTNVASISCEGHIVTNGSLTLGGNVTNTSGVRQVYNSTTKSLDFVFVA